MEKEVFDNGHIVIDKNKLYFYGDTLNINILESAWYELLPRRSIFTGIKEWIYGFIAMVIICNIWRNLVIIGDIYILSGIPLIIYNIYAFFIKNYLLVIRTLSGKEYYAKGRDPYAIGEVVAAINRRIELTSKESVIVNNGIINKGNNNINKMGEK